MSILRPVNFFSCRLSCRTDASNLSKTGHRCCALRFRIKPESKRAGQGRGFSLESRSSFAAHFFRAQWRQRNCRLRTVKSKEQRLRSLQSSSWVSPVARLSSQSLPQATQISKAVNPSAVTVLPAGLQRIAAYEIKAGKLEALPGVGHTRAQDIAEHIRLATARRAGTCASQKLEVEIRLGSVVPM